MANTSQSDGAYVTDPVVKDSNATYTPGISERRSGTTKHLSHNLKSVDSQTTAGQSVAASRVYDAFGNVTSSTGTFVGPFGYGGGFGYQEEATGLKLLGHRMYDSSTGRFLTRDPIKDGRNWYVYCDSDPVSFVDPGGRRAVSISIGFGFIMPLVGGNVSIGVGYDLDNGHVGVIGKWGIGPGAGFGAGGSAAIGYDHPGRINGTGGGWDSGWSPSLATPFVSADYAVDDNGNPLGVSVGGGVGPTWGESIGVVVPKTGSLVFDFSQAVMDFFEAIKDLIETEHPGRFLPWQWSPEISQALDDGNY